MSYPKHIGTLGDIAAGGLKLAIHCEALNGCRRGGEDVDLDALRAELGDDYKVADYVARLRCDRCGARWPDVTIRVSPIDTGGSKSP